MKYISVFQNTIGFFFEKCSLRVHEKILQTQIPLKDIYPDNEKLISHIRHNKRYSNTNRYLLTDIVINDCEENKSNNEKVGLVPILFDNNTQTLLWGTDEEILQNLPTIFNYIIKDLSEMPQEYGVDINFILSDYAPYAFNFTYLQLLFKNNISLTDFSYGVAPKEIIKNIPITQKEAITFLYQKCNDEFKEIFFNFIKETKSYLKIDKVFEKNFIIAKFIPLLKKYIPHEDSIGLRVKYLITTDISKSAELIAQHSNQNVFTELDRKLVRLSSQYAFDLMKLQKEYYPLFIEKHSH